MEIKLAPSILAADFGRLTEQVQEIERAGDVDRIHVDVMDGRFVPNLSFGPMVVSVIRRATRLPLDLHLMIVEPGQYYPAYVDSGANALTVHLEACPHLYRDLEEIRRLGSRAGVAVNPGTAASSLEAVLDVAEIILVMSVSPGFGGQAFIPGSVAKIARIRGLLDAAGSTADLAVDGGIGPATAGDVVKAGANVLVAGSSVFHHPDGVAAGLRALRRSVAE